MALPEVLNDIFQNHLGSHPQYTAAVKSQLDWIVKQRIDDPKVVRNYLVGLTNVLKVNFANPNFLVPLNNADPEAILEGWSNLIKLEDYVGDAAIPVVEFDPANPQAFIDYQNKLLNRTAFRTGQEMGLAFNVAQNSRSRLKFVDEDSAFDSSQYDSIRPKEQIAKLEKLISEVEVVRGLVKGVKYDPTNIEHRKKLAKIVNGLTSGTLDAEAVKRKVLSFHDVPNDVPDKIEITDPAATLRKPTVLYSGVPLDLLYEELVKLKPQKVIRLFNKLYRGGASVFVLGLTAPVIISEVYEHAERRNIPFLEAARELGLELSEDDLKSMAAEALVDVGVSLTPVGALKKAWEIFGNVDDVIAVTQLYGEAFPDNEIIQQMAAIARDVEQSEAFAVYIYSRDALTGAVGSAIDWALGGEDEAEVAARLAGVRGALSGEDGAVANVVREGGTAAELTEALISDATTGLESGFVPLSNKPLIPGAASILAPEFSRTTRPGAGSAAGVGNPVPPAKPGSGPLAASGPEAGQSAEAMTAGSAASMPGQGPADADKLERKTSYDRFTRLGRTPEEEAEAVDDYINLLERSFVDMNGDEEAADLLATERFVETYGTSKFSPYAEGTVFKYPAENVYLDLHGDGHAYIREDAEALLKEKGIKTGKWYLSPNTKTGSDWEQGWADEDGYGPRMTLSYDDEAGNRLTLTESFQADVKTAAERKPGERTGVTHAKPIEPGESAVAKTPLSVKAPLNVPVPAAKPLPPVPTAAAGAGRETPLRMPSMPPMPRERPMAGP